MIKVVQTENGRASGYSIKITVESGHRVVIIAC